MGLKQRIKPEAKLRNSGQGLFWPHFTHVTYLAISRSSNSWLRSENKFLISVSKRHEIRVCTRCDGWEDPLSDSQICPLPFSSMSLYILYLCTGCFNIGCIHFVNVLSVHLDEEEEVFKWDQKKASGRAGGWGGGFCLWSSQVLLLVACHVYICTSKRLRVMAKVCTELYTFQWK